ncbi:MAG: hypothetical protein AB7F59_10515 [Bdellovibrionales bacterium]
MKLKALLLLSFLFCPSLEAFTGAGSTEATLEFSHFVEFDLQESPQTPTKGAILEAIEEQIAHLVGPMARLPYRSAPKGDEYVDPESLRMEWITNEAKEKMKLRAHYNYEGTIVVANGAATPYEIYLPLHPADAYFKAGGDSEDNPCGDEYYTSYDDFWYFWHPLRPNCRKLLKEGIDYHKIPSKLTRIPNSSTPRGEKTYPEYGRLADAKGTIKMMLLMGMDVATNNPHPIESEGEEDDDLNAENFRMVRNALIKKLQLQPRQWENSEIQALLKEGTRPLPYVEEFTAEFPDSKGRGQRLEVVMFFGKAGIDENSKAFHYFLKDAIKNYSVVIYDGHSGLGGHLYLPGIEELRTETSGQTFKFVVPKDKYQIFYFNSCSSYAYYNANFFPQKKSPRDPHGTKFLDIVATGLETGFDGGARTNLELITTIYNWIKLGTVKSYLELVRRLENDNLSGVNGDEDNPKSQAEARQLF